MADQGRQGGSAHLNHPPQTHSTAQSAGRGLKGAGRKRKKRTNQPQSDEDAQQSSAQSGVGTDPSPSDNKRLRIAAGSSSHLYGLGGDSTQAEPSVANAIGKRKSSSSRKQSDSLASSSKKVQLSSRGALFSSLVGRINETVDASASSSASSDKERKSHHKLDKKQSSSGFAYKSESSTSGDKSLPLILTSGSTSLPSVAPFSASGSSTTSQKKYSSTSLPSCSTSSGLGESAGGGLKKLVSHYSLRSKGSAKNASDTTGSASTVTPTTNTSAATWTVVPLGSRKRPAQSDSSTVGGNFSGSAESWENNSTGKQGHRRTSATTGSCTSTSRRWGGGGGGAVPNTSSSSKGADCSNMSDDQPNPCENPTPSGGNGNGASGGVDSESDDSDVGRLQALLEARGLPPHLFGALAPRMQHLLHRTIGTTSTTTKAQQLLQGLQASSDEGRQMQAVIEMCQMLVMGNEDTLAGFPVKQVVPALIALLNMEHNFDMMNHACRALTYMMEALPRSSAVVLDALPVFLEKLQAIQCMDVAEQSLTALEMLSRRHSKAILQARGVWACLMYLDFFSINAQRAALAITAKCCQNLLPEELHLVQQSIPLLSSRLTQQDQKSLESVCLALSRLVESLQEDPPKLQEIASPDLLTNLQQLLTVSPPLINTGTFITVVRMLTTMCSSCPELALTLLKNNIAETLCYLLTGRADTTQGEIELVARSPQEVYEMTCLISELMPRLPQHALFAVDTLLDRPSARSTPETVSWQWRDDMGVWHAYTPLDSRIIEAAHQTGEDETSLSNLGRTYTVDFQTMQQINEDTGTSRPIERRVIRPQALTTNSSATNNNTSHQESSIDNDLKDVAGSFIRSLFSVLYEVYSSSAGPAVRCKCLKALLRMVYFASPELLKDVLKAQTVSSQLAGMMASQDLRIVVSALQIAEILLQKLPDIFSVHFTREGVIHEIKQLADPGVPLGASPTKVSTPTTVSPSSSNVSTPGPSTSTPNGAVFRVGSSSTTPESPQEELFMNVTDDETALSDCSPISRRMKDLRKQKRTSKRDKHSAKAAAAQQSQVAPPQANSEASGDVPSSNNFGWSSRYTRTRRSTSKTPNFLASLNPARWGRAASERNFHKASSNQKTKEASSLSKCSSSSNLWAGNREKVRAWVRERAGKFILNFASSDSSVSQDPSKILVNLTQAIIVLQSATGDKRAALIELRDTLMSCDISPFEVNHSGLVKALLLYLAMKDDDRPQRIRTFLNVFAKCPLDENGRDSTSIDPTCFQVLVSKLNCCISQLEQFPVKVHDLPAPAGSTTALKFFNTHQLKCQLARHPDCTNLKQWKGGTVKIDPLALVQAIERYLVVRGFGKVRDKHSSQSDDENSEEDIDDSLVGVVAGTRHKLQFLINDTVLPYNMTVYQAVRQFSPAAGGASDQSETDTDSEAPLGPASIWVQTHIVHYRPVMEDEATNKANSVSAAPRKGKSGCKSTKKKQDELWLEGTIPKKMCPMDRYLVSDLSSKKVTINDASLSVLCLLNSLHSVSVHWHSLYPAIQGRPILPQLEFVNNKIAAKAGRQLQDPLVIMTGNLPGWLQQIATACPFLLPFETRQLLLYATAFDRDRALQRLLDAAPELSGAADTERVTPRLERRKRTVSREDILKQAETLIQDMATSKALLEVQYENEVGTGLGPTLEFYALVSRELQRSDLELWHDDSGAARQDGFVSSPVGLFPAPVARSTRVSQVVKLRNKFKFIGKFMAKAVMDSRMLDLPLSPTFFRWLLGEESSLGLADLAYVNPSVHKTLVRLVAVVAQYKDIVELQMSEEQKKAKIESLELDGCPIEALSLDFTLPGYPQIEMRKGGKDMSVTPYNLEQYISLVVHWYLVEGVQRQMESVREGMQVVFSTSHLGLFYPSELDAIFCGSSTGWEVSALMESCRPDHGYASSSRAIKFLFDILSSYGPVDQRDFVQFITGSPRLPVGGFKALSPPLTIVRKTIDGNANADDFLPSVMTCVNYLKLPDYSTVEIMREKLRIAAKEGQCSFHLS